MMVTKEPNEPGTLITEEQWVMPVSFDATGQPISLRDYVAAKRQALSFDSLNDDQRIVLAAQRIALQPDYAVSTLRQAGGIDQREAIANVLAKTKLGRKLAQIETRVVLHLLAEVAKPRT